MTILITGGTGLIGTALSKALTANGHEAIILSRQAKKASKGNIHYAQWDVNKGTIDRTAIERTDAIIHLAGANVADGRWTEKRKKEIVDSRVKSGELLVNAMSEIPNRIQTVISSSAIGIYGADPTVPNNKPFVETVDLDDSFLGSTCQQWEAAIEPVEGLGKRLVILRTGIVLSREGGAYEEFRKPLRFGIASVLGSGKQVVSWIHVDDLVVLYMHALQHTEVNGVYNAVAPQPVSNWELVKQIAKAKGGFSIAVPVPAFVLKLMLGEMSIEVLKSATVSCKKIQQAGFSFQYPTIEGAAHNLENVNAHS